MMSIWMATELNVQIESEYLPEYLELRNIYNTHEMVDHHQARIILNSFTKMLLTLQQKKQGCNDSIKF